MSQQSKSFGWRVGTATSSSSKLASAQDNAVNDGEYYKNPYLSDVTIIYGEHGEKSFPGHRLVLDRTCGWFKTAFQSSFLEADSRTITLKGDYPEGLEGLFEFAYKNKYQYKIDVKTFKDPKVEIIQHARIFAVANKYQARRLEDHALWLFERLLNMEKYEKVVAPFIIEQLYLHPEEIFREDDDTQAPKTAVMKREDDEVALALDGTKEQEQTQSLKRPAAELDGPDSTAPPTKKPFNPFAFLNASNSPTEDQSKSAMMGPREAEAHDGGPKHAPDRLKKPVVDFVLKKWRTGSDLSEFRKLGQDIPLFGVDMFLAMVDRQ